MSEIVERVAQAIAKANEPSVEWEKNYGSVRDDYRDIARAAIEAMREPTRAMLDAGYEVAGESSKAVRLTWNEMIDAALLSTKETNTP